HPLDLLCRQRFRAQAGEKVPPADLLGARKFAWIAADAEQPDRRLTREVAADDRPILDSPSREMSQVSAVVLGDLLVEQRDQAEPHRLDVRRCDGELQ